MWQCLMVSAELVGFISLVIRLRPMSSSREKNVMKKIFRLLLLSIVFAQPSFAQRNNYDGLICKDQAVHFCILRPVPNRGIYTVIRVDIQNGQKIETDTNILCYTSGSNTCKEILESPPCI